MEPEEISDSAKITIPHELPILPLRDTVVYPFIVIPLQVSRQKSIRLVDDAMLGDKIIGLFTQRDGSINDPDFKDIFEFGVAAQIMKKLKMPDESIQIFVHGIERIKIDHYLMKEPYFKAKIKEIKFKEETDIEVMALVNNAVTLFEKMPLQQIVQYTNYGFNMSENQNQLNLFNS